jgi:hypothetical protein
MRATIINLCYEAAAAVRVIDTFEIKESYPTSHEPGVVAVLDSSPAPDAQAFVGKSVRVRPTTGAAFDAPVDGARDHLKTVSFFFKGLTKEDIPIGSCIEVEG